MNLEDASPVFPANTEQRCRETFERWQKLCAETPDHAADYAGLALLMAEQLVLINPEILTWLKDLPRLRRSGFEVVE